MVGKCANNLCSAFHAEHEGKLFRLDLDIANVSGETQRKTAYIWLCAACSRQMSPKVSVEGDTVRLALTCQNAAFGSLSAPRVN